MSSVCETLSFSFALCLFPRGRLVSRHPRHSPDNSSLVIFLPLSLQSTIATQSHCYLPVHTSNSASVQSSPAHPIPIRRERFWFNCLAIVNLKTKDIGYVNCLLCLSCHTTHHTHTPSCVASAPSPPGSVESHHSTPVSSQSSQAPPPPLASSSPFSLPPFPHLSLSHSPPVCWSGLAVRTLLWFCCLVVRFFLLLSAWDCGPKPTAHLPAQARLSQHSAVPCGSIGTFFSQSNSPSSPSRLAHSLAGSHLPMELQVQVRL